MQQFPNTAAFAPGYWPSARQFNEAVQCPAVCFQNPQLKNTLAAVDRLGMPLVTSGQFAYVYKLKSTKDEGDFAVRCFRGYLGDRDHRYRAIQSFLKSHPNPFVSDFTYSAEGILISGNRYPILFMKWIDGPTLDLYIEEMIERKDVILHLAQEWLRLVSSLKNANIAHGDLQHGNVIVEHGSLRLVDHDGMFVPAMEGWQSSEVGHQHYQHPQRSAGLFNSNLDNFSAIVIYLSLISLAEAPDLWRTFHDENLLFTRSDFASPDSSQLFAKIGQLGDDHKRIADALSSAAKGSPEEVPSLLELVTAKNALPSWITTTIDLEAQTKTREVAADPTARKEHPRWIPKKDKEPASSFPASPQSSSYQTLFSNQPGPAPGLPYGRDPLAVWRNTPTLGKELLGKTFVWWYWTFYFLLQFIGFDFFISLTIAVASLTVICLTYGHYRARQIASAALQAKQSGALNLPPDAQQIAAAPPKTSTYRQPAASSVTSNDPIIGNMALTIYHHANCDWVQFILNKNRISFLSAADATQAGYKPCQVCSRA